MALPECGSSLPVAIVGFPRRLSYNRDEFGTTQGKFLPPLVWKVIPDLFNLQNAVCVYDFRDDISPPPKCGDGDAVRPCRVQTQILRPVETSMRRRRRSLPPRHTLQAPTPPSFTHLHRLTTLFQDRLTMGKRKHPQVQVFPTRKSPRFARRASPFLRLPPELLLELGRFCEEDVPALKETCQLPCAVYSRPNYIALKIFCGGLHFTADDVKRVERVCKSLLGPLEHGRHVQFLAIYDFRSGIRMHPSSSQII